MASVFVGRERKGDRRAQAEMIPCVNGNVCSDAFRVGFLCAPRREIGLSEIDRSRLQQNAGGVRLPGILFFFLEKKKREEQRQRLKAAAAQTRRRRTCKCAAFHGGTD